MKKINILGLILLMVVVLLTALVAPAHVASWSERITGGGQAVVGSTHFSITVSAWTTDERDAGQMEYSRSNLSIHAKIQCVGIHQEGDVAVVAGPADAQNDPDGLIGSGEWMVVEILEGGVGSGDRVRVRLMTQAEAIVVCGNPSGSFPALIYDGNFNIRSK